MLGLLISKIRAYRARRRLNRLVQKGLRIGHNTHLQDGVFIDPAHCFLISIGDHCALAPNVRLIAHDASPNRSLRLTRLAPITIEARCFIGDSAVIMPGVRIGPDAIIGAGSVVTRDVPPNSVAAGNPARVLCSLEAFLAKHREKAAAGRTFGYGEYDIGVITPERKQQMTAYLKAGGAGYMGARSSF